MRPIINPALLTTIALAALLAGCSSSPYADATRRSNNKPITTGLNTLAQQDTPASEPANLDIPDEPSAWEQAALDLQQVLNDQAEPAPAAPTTPPAQSEHAPALNSIDEPPASITPDQPTAAAELPAARPPEQTEPVSSSTQPESPAPTLAQQARTLASAIRAAAPTSDDPTTDLVRAAILTNLWPDATTSPTPTITLAPVEQTRVTVAAQLARVLASPDATTPSLLSALDQARTDLTADGSGFAIAHAQLARRVEGYGKYDPFPAHTFLAGKPNRLIVYTEPVNFGYRAPTASDRSAAPSRTTEARWVVDLSQQLTLYHEASADLQAWHRPKARIIDASRNRQRDYYLINEIVLPANLSVGSYRLKIATRDETTGALAETTIKIDLVADPALAYGNR